MPTSRQALTQPIHGAKLRRPQVGPGFVPRPRLTARLDLAPSVPLTLVSAPAGFGKTSLLAEWADTLDTPPAWLTADSGDRELSRFVVHAIAAIEPLVTSLDLGAVARDLFRRPRAVAAGDLGEFLADALLELPRDVVLVVDDYHLAASVDVENLVGGLLRFMPPAFHLVLATRSDPTLPLARLRLQGQVIELRGEDLRLSEEEVRALLAISRGNAGDPALAEVLRQTTGGWVAGLRMIALALPASTDPTRITEAIASDRHFMDFLVEEILAAQTGEVQELLVRTAIVDRVCAPLADALLDQPPPGGSLALLASLGRERFFFEPEGDDGVWFRRHRLVHSLLLHQLESRLPDTLADLHRNRRRMFDWFQFLDCRT